MSRKLIVNVRNATIAFPAGVDLTDIVTRWAENNDVDRVEFEHETVTYGIAMGESWLGALYDVLDRALARARRIRSQYPHVCPNCGADAYIGAYDVDCKARCKYVRVSKDPLV